MSYDPYRYPPPPHDPYQPTQHDPYQAPVQPYSPPPGPLVPAPQPYQPPYPPPYGYAVPIPIAYVPARPSSGLAVWALVMGLVGMFFGWCLLGLPCIAAVVLGHAALADTKSGEKSGRGQAAAGLALGYLALAPALILFFMVVLGGLVGGAESATR